MERYSLAGTVDLYRCTISANSTSCSLRNTTNAINGCNAPAAVAPAQHAIAASLTTGSELVLLGNDGGLWRSTDGVNQTGAACSATDVQHFDNLNSAIGAGGSLAEVVGFAQDPTEPGTLIAGLGANGSASTIVRRDPRCPGRSSLPAKAASRRSIPTTRPIGS